MITVKGKSFKEYPEAHQFGRIEITHGKIGEADGVYKVIEGDLGIQVAKDGKAWICINGIAFVRFIPENIYNPTGK